MISILTPPEALPLTTADYQAQNNLTDARLIYESYPVVSGNVVKGSRFLILGSTFIGVSATAISGTLSDYVVLTVSGSTAVPSYIPNLTDVTWSNIYNGYYDSSNNLVVFDEMKAFILGAITKPNLFYNKIISDITNQVLLKSSDVNFNKISAAGEITDKNGREVLALNVERQRITHAVTVGGVQSVVFTFTKNVTGISYITKMRTDITSLTMTENKITVSGKDVTVEFSTPNPGVSFYVDLTVFTV